MPTFDRAENAVTLGQVLLQDTLMAHALCCLLICVHLEHLHHLGNHISCWIYTVICALLLLFLRCA